MRRLFRRLLSHGSTIASAYSRWQPHRSLPLLSSLPVRQRDIVWYHFEVAADTKVSNWGLWVSRACKLVVFLMIMLPGVLLLMLMAHPIGLAFVILSLPIASLAADWAYTRVLCHLLYAVMLQTLPGHCPDCGYDARATVDPYGPILSRCPECGRSLH
jgi:hypothetical protein